MTLDPAAFRKMVQDYTAAWNSGDPAQVAAFYAPDCGISANRGEWWLGEERMKTFAGGFFAEVPDLKLTCDDFRLAGNHAVFVWSFTGHHVETGNPLNIQGWEEWELGPDLRVTKSLGWFDADEYARQIAG